VTAILSGVARRTGRLGHAVGRFSGGITAVSIKELRGRMRDRRAFMVLTIYLLLLSGFAFAAYQYLRQQATQSSTGTLPDMGWWPGAVSSSGTALSANIGHGIFSGLLVVETLLVLVLAPAFTSGAISMEREKQTIDMLVTTPLSTLGMIIGKLLSALTYVFLLIIASIPLASLVFVFGGVGPEDLVRGYVMLFALAFGMGAIGLFISALVKRTQTSTVVTYVVVLVLAIGSVGVHQFLTVVTRPDSNRLVVSQGHQAPEALLWLNPFVANLDLICTTNPGSYHESCVYISMVTRRPYFGTFTPTDGPQVAPGMPRGAPIEDDGPWQPVQPQTTSLGFPRDTFWPKSAAAFLLTGLLLTGLATQLVSPTRRLRLPVPVGRRRRPAEQPVEAVE